RGERSGANRIEQSDGECHGRECRLLEGGILDEPTHTCPADRPHEIDPRDQDYRWPNEREPSDVPGCGERVQAEDTEHRPRRDREEVWKKEVDRGQAVHFGSDADPVEHLACPDEGQDVEGAERCCDPETRGERTERELAPDEALPPGEDRGERHR